MDANQVGLLEQYERGAPTLGMSHKSFRQAEVKYWDNEASLTSTPYNSETFRESWDFIQFMSYFEIFDEESPIEIMLYDIRTYIWNNIDKICGIMKINTEQNPIDLKIIFDELISKKENIDIYLEHLDLNDTKDGRPIETIDIDKYIKHYQNSVSDIYLKFERNGIILREKQVEIMDDSFWLDKVELSQSAFACMLGGKEGRTLFISTANSSNQKDCLEERSARIETIEVQVPRAGLP